MKYLIDTHVLLWYMADPDGLSQRALATMLDAESELYWSAVSLWEITVKISLGKLEMAADWERQIEDEKKANRVRDLPLFAGHCPPNLTLPWIHRDPFDRLLISQAIVEGLCLITKDRNIRKYPVRTLW